MTLEARNLVDTAEVTLYRKGEARPYNPRVSSTLPGAKDFVLKPDPIMRLERIVGCHPMFQSGKVYFSRDQKKTKEIIYTQANMIVSYYEPTQKQRLFYDPKRPAPIE